jgi:hypothetical protein
MQVSNEPPSDMKSNMRRAFAAFTAEQCERPSTDAKRAAFRSILFGLCFYHSLLLGRKKFGVGALPASKRLVDLALLCYDDHTQQNSRVTSHCYCTFTCMHAVLRAVACSTACWPYLHHHPTDRPGSTHLLRHAGIGTGSGSGLGFCRGYSFNMGDLTTCGDVLYNYLEAYESIPWPDLRYMFGEVCCIAD